ncbi:alpha-hydroxyketone-type quorum-sensing autoinducer synthase [Streptacidiphilus jiangxiensis]|uniref:8-amino-7-oxononanoate synthase n=1 Tax=Streptacidiphilus jiangxiensis TaxID=235985 RepID=A0A1H7T305_STRJI|nr:alpha-hydroxyketone-type quorum-sensing autoinducer synthase [Streptacidiphilus jiangxiensis]SEL78656.1 CAI-1 autoinducer synthase [Streptacidiphilus jiangxiensis]
MNRPPRLPAGFRERIDHFYAARVQGAWDGRWIFEGSIPGPGSVCVTNNDYLALAHDRRITCAMTRALASRGSATLMSGVFLADGDPQALLEQRLAAHLGYPTGVLCQSGWAANAGLLQTIAGPDTPVYVDVLAHMSLWAGARSAGATVHPFRHNDPGHLARLVARHGRGVVLVDSVYSTDGSVSPLAEIAASSRAADCVLVVDESHSLGTHGPRGAGMVAELGISENVHFITASLSKAFAGRAGIIAAGEPRFARYFKMSSYPAIFSSTLLPHDVAGLAAALDVVRAEQWRRDRLHQVAALVRGGLIDTGLNLRDSRSQIVSIEAGGEREVMRLRDDLEREGIFGSVFCPPATVRRRSMVRLSLHAALTDVDAERIVVACRAVVGASRRPPASARRLLRASTGSGLLAGKARD